MAAQILCEAGGQRCQFDSPSSEYVYLVDAREEAITSVLLVQLL